MSPNLEVTIMGHGKAEDVFASMDILRTELAASGFDIHSIIVKESTPD